MRFHVSAAAAANDDDRENETADLVNGVGPRDALPAASAIKYLC